MKKETITTKDKNDDEVKLDIYMPNGNQLSEGQSHYAVRWCDCVKKRVPLREDLDMILRTAKQWDDEREQRYQSLLEGIRAKREKIEAGGIKLSEAKKIVFDIMDDMQRINELLVKRREADLQTAESIADNHRFNYFVSVCTYYADTKNPYFRDLDGYLERMDEPAANDAARKLASMLIPDLNVADSFEIEFLKKYKIMNKEGDLVNKEGKRVDREGRLIDEKGNYIDKEGNLVDINGKRVDEKGRHIVETKPFLDDDGKPILINNEEEEEKEEKEGWRINSERGEGVNDRRELVAIVEK